MVGAGNWELEGEVLREDVIRPLNLTVTEAAKCLGVTLKTLSALINCKASLSAEMAIKIAKATDTSPESWFNMQAKLDLWKASQRNYEIIGFSEATATA